MILDLDYGKDFGKPTRFKDKNGNRIHLGDYIHVQQYADDDYENNDGMLDYEGIVENWNGEIMVVYYDIGVREPENIHCFPKQFREILHKWNEVKQGE